MSRKHIAILRGGPSSEYDVSLKSGKSVIDELRDDHQIKDIIIDKQGNWYLSGLPIAPVDAIRGVDVVFNAMHGEYGEDGTIQKLLETFSIPYTGPKPYGAALSMNKVHAKQKFAEIGLQTPYAKMLKKAPGLDIDEIAHTLFRSMPMPVVLKPVDKGSSVGVIIARDFKTLYEGLNELLFANDQVMIEEYISGKEGTVGVIDGFRGHEQYALMPIEIRTPSHLDFFDYDAKYSGVTEEICPGNFSNDEKMDMLHFAMEAHKILDLRHYSRSDFVIHPKRGVFILETNSLPGLTSESLMPKGLEPVGSSYREFLEHVIGLALDGK